MRRLVLVSLLAIGAALLGAPSPASAAGNALTDAAATPAQVAPGGIVLLSVTYEGKVAATAVSAEVAGLTLPLVRRTGTPTSGTWASTVTLPVGTWTVVYRATTTQGNSPTLTGPSITVGGAPAPTTAPSHSGGSDTDGATALPVATDPVASIPQPPAAPAASLSPTGAPAGDEPAPAVIRDPVTEAAADSDPEVAAPALPPPVAASAAPQPRADEPAGSTEGDGVVPSPDVGADLPEGPASAGQVSIGMGLVGLAAIAVVAAGLVAAGRERRRLEARPSPVGQEVADVLGRRTIRQGRIRLEADPIVDALGLDDAADGDSSAPDAPEAG